MTVLHAPRAPVVDPKSGAISREWLRFFTDVVRVVSDSRDDDAVLIAMQPDRGAEVDGVRRAVAELAAEASMQPDRGAELEDLRRRIEALELEAAMRGGGDPFVSRRPING